MGAPGGRAGQCCCGVGIKVGPPIGVFEWIVFVMIVRFDVVSSLKRAQRGRLDQACSALSKG